tara:strand:- start:6955 stop:8763 length:1809 start_codon:yes stop_codon:yes gene_type:complete
MALVVKDRVKQTTTTTGTGSIVLNGNVSGFQTFAAALANADTTYYGIFEPSTNAYEVGLGTWTESTATLARTTILESSNSGNAVSLSAQAEVFITQPAEKAVYLDANDDIDLGGNKVLFGNVYSSTGDLPSASTYHGMFAHVHGTGKGYFAHAGNWVELANQADVTAAVNALVDSAPGTLDTLNELAAALGDDASFSTTVTNSIATKLPLAGGAMTGAITTNSTFDGRDVATDGTKLDGIATSANNYTHPSHAGDDINIDTGALSGATVISDLDFNVTTDTLGHVTDANATIATRNITLANLGYTGATNANYITNNNQLTNGAGYTTYTSNQATNTSSNVTHNQVTGTAWVYTPGYLQAPNAYIDNAIYHGGDTDTYLGFATNTITLATGGSSEITVNTTGVRLGDTGNGYFQPVTGDYGSIQADGGHHGGWEGYSIGGRAVFMHDNSSTMGLLDDVHNEWGFRYTFNGAAELYHNGTSKLATGSTGVGVTGIVSAESLQEDYDAASGTTPTLDADNAGYFSLTTSGNTTFTFGGVTSGRSVGFILSVTAGGGHSLTWPSSVDWAGGAAPDAPASGASNLYVFVTRDGGSNWVGVLSSAAYA